MKVPQAPDCESSLIGALLIVPNRMGEAAATLTPADFYKLSLSRIYERMLNLWARGVTPDLATVADDLRQRDELDGVGGPGELVGLQAQAVSFRLPDYIAAVLDASVRRRLGMVATQVRGIAEDWNVTVPEALVLARQALDAVEYPLTVESEAVDFGTFIAGEDTYDWVVPDLLEHQERLIVVAGEGRGKSVLCRQMAVTCSAGVHPFGGRAFDPVRTLLVDLENPVSVVRRSLRPLHTQARRLRPMYDSQSLQIITQPGGLDVTRRSDALWLVDQVTAIRPDLLVIGPLYKMHGVDDNWERGARTVAVVLDDIRERIGCAMVIETHAPQGMGGANRVMRPLGSSLWLRWPEFGFSLVPTENDPKVVRFGTWRGSRDERNWPKFLERGGEWPWTPCGEPKAGKNTNSDDRFTTPRRDL